MRSDHHRLIAGRLKRSGACAFVWIGVAFLAACASPTAQRIDDDARGNGFDAQMNYWHTLATRELISNEEAVHGLFLLVDEETPDVDYPTRVAMLKDRGLISDGFAGPPEQAATRGLVAVAIARILDVPGGVMFHLFPRSPRYAARELEHLGLFPTSSPHQPLAGPAYLAIIGRAQDHLAGVNRVTGANLPEPADEPM